MVFCAFLLVLGFCLFCFKPVCIVLSKSLLLVFVKWCDPVPGDIKDQTWCGPAQPDLVGLVPAHCRGIGKDDI